MEDYSDDEDSATVSVRNAKHPLKSKEDTKSSTLRLYSVFSVCLGFLCVAMTANIIYMRPKCLDCRVGWLSFRGHCYWFSDRGHSLNFWNVSRDLCQHDSGYLAIIDDLEEQKFIVKHAKPYESQHQGYWIGLHHKLAGWFWVDGRKNALDFWTKEVPHSSGAALHMPQRKAKESWRAEDKAVKHRFICEHPMTVWPYN